MPSASAPARDTMYVYIDEAGNRDFGAHGTQFFALTGVVVRRPFRHVPALLDAKYDALETGLDLEYFHASEDRHAVRDQAREAERTRPPRLSVRKSPMASCHRGGSFEISVPER